MEHVADNLIGPARQAATTVSKSPFENLRERAEADIAERTDHDKPQSRRPSWAPPLVLSGELLDLCIKLKLPITADKPIARLWAQFADPKQVGRVLREGNRDRKNAMPEITCRGFELYAGDKRGKRSELLFEAQRRWDGKWQVGPYPSSPSHDPFYAVHHAQQKVREYQTWVDRHPEVQHYADELARCQQTLADAEAKEQQRFQKATERYQWRERATELAAARVAEFAGNQDVEMRFAGQLCGQCCECFRLLTDPKSREIGIGPECVQHALCLSPQGKFVRIIDAIADGRIAAVDGELRWLGGR